MYYGFRPSSTAVDTISLHALDPTVPRKRMQIGFLLAPIVKEVSNIVSNLLKSFLLQRLTLYNYFIPFCATVKTITHEVLWMTRCTVASASGNSASGDPQHLVGDSFDCCTERYEIVVLLPNSEDTCYWKYFLKFE